MNTEELNLVVHLVAKFIALSSFIALIGILLGLAFLSQTIRGIFNLLDYKNYFHPFHLLG